MTAIVHGRLRCARCRRWLRLCRFAEGEGPTSRAGRAWCCAWCAPHAERERERAQVPGQAALPLETPEPGEADPAARIFD